MEGSKINSQPLPGDPVVIVLSVRRKLLKGNCYGGLKYFVGQWIVVVFFVEP